MHTAISLFGRRRTVATGQIGAVVDRMHVHTYVMSCHVMA